MAEDVDRLVGRMADALRALVAERDPGRFFLGTYLRTTEAVDAALEAGAFEDPNWVAAWSVDFARLYLDALAAYRADDDVPARPWQLAFGADPRLPPEVHVLLGINAHINYDQPQSLVRTIPPDGFADARLMARRHRDHRRIDAVLAARVSAEDVALASAGGRRTPLDRLLAPANRAAARVFLREARRTVWTNTGVLHAARMQGDEHYRARLAGLEAASAARVADLLRGGPVMLRLAARGFGVLIT